MNHSRLSDMSITDDIWRVELYKRILNYLDDPENIDNITRYEVKEDEKYRPDLLSERVYKTLELRWLVMLTSGIDDEFASLPIGYEIELPPLSAVRSMIREIKDNVVT